MNTTGIQLWNKLYDTFYPEQTEARFILEKHSRSVADLALEINEQQRLGLDPTEVETAAMLHDIGVFLTDAPSIHCHGLQPYIRHGILGADLLRRHGIPESAARVAERHTGTGLPAEEIISLGLPLPTDRCLEPETLLERLICYADKFYSKSRDMSRKSLDRVRASMAKHSQASINRFEALHQQFNHKI